jgi:hypothetical protein
VSGRRDPGRNHHGLRGDPVIHPRLAVGGIQEDVGENGVIQRPFLESRQFFVQFAADAGDLGFRDPAVRSEGFDQVIDRAGRDAVHVGLHHHGEQRPVDPPPAFHQRREERPAAHLRVLQVQVAGLRGQQAFAVAVAPRRARLGVLMRRGTDHLGGLRLDQLLQDALAHHPDCLNSIGPT